MREKWIEQQREIHGSTITVEDFNTPLSEMAKSRRQKISKNIIELNSTID